MKTGPKPHVLLPLTLGIKTIIFRKKIRESTIPHSRSPSQHRSRSTSAALRQASVMSGDPGSGLTIGPNAWLKRKLHLRPQHRGVHLVTEEILAGLPELSQFQVRKIIYLPREYE